MITIQVKCPKCGKVAFYSFGSGDETCIGDEAYFYDKTFSKKHTTRCFCCDKAFNVWEIVKNGLLINILLNPTKEEIEDIEDEKYPFLYEYPNIYFSFPLVGEDTHVIPAQFTAKCKFNIGEKINLLGVCLTIGECYKVFDGETLHARIYKVYGEKGEERLLVLRDNYLPALKEIDWEIDAYKDEEEKFFKYVIPEGCELVMDIS